MDTANPLTVQVLVWRDAMVDHAIRYQILSSSIKRVRVYDPNAIVKMHSKRDQMHFECLGED